MVVILARNCCNMSKSVSIVFSLDRLVQCCLEELEQKVLLPLVGGVVVQGEDDCVHELGGLILGHLEDQLGQVGWICLRRRRSRDASQITGDTTVTMRYNFIVSEIVEKSV